jgi:acetyl esterase
LKGRQDFLDGDLTPGLRSRTLNKSEVGPAARQRLEFHAVRLISALPPKVQVLLSGRPPIRVDGQTLEPEIQLGVSLLERRGKRPLQALSVAEARTAYSRQIGRLSGPSTPVGVVRDLVFDGATGPFIVRHYAPEEGGGPRPLLVFFHGGGFVLGDLETHDAPCRLLCRHSGAHVLSVDYQRAPEHPFPAAVEDGLAALR